ncbi:MAG: hypothetical protein QOK02_2711 [Mycobacterium sp.]|jgi:GNAT superfamily N-acetyltransferase|nr:hypothetical protein [Mycobacterium sp.]
MLEENSDAQAEAVEAEFMYQYESMASASTKARLGISTARIGGGVVLSMRHDVTGYWSKALGFGFTEPVTSSLIDEVVSFYRAADSAGAVIQIAPTALPADWNEISLRHNISPESSWIKLGGRPDALRRGQDTALRVGPVGPKQVEEWATVTLNGFGMPLEGLVEMMAASAANPDFRPYAAWDGDEIVATANLFIRNGVASLNSAATLPTYRNRGAQSALIDARAKEAAHAGCRWAVAECGKTGDAAANPSLNNLLRAGMRPLYTRQNWIWRPLD